MSKPKTIQVTQSEVEPITKEVLASAIVKIGEAATALRRSGINRRGIVALLQDKTKLGKNTIETVLAGLEDLRHDYVG